MIEVFRIAELRHCLGHRGPYLIKECNRGIALVAYSQMIVRVMRARLPGHLRYQFKIIANNGPEEARRLEL